MVLSGDALCRLFTPADRDACLAVFDTNVPDFFRASERAEFDAFLADLPGPYLVLENDDGVVACGGYALRAEDGVADLCWGMVRRSLHRGGWGSMLTRRRLELALQDARVAEVALSTSQHTVDFYRRFGFRVAKVEADGHGPGLDRCDMRLARSSGEGPA